MTDTPTHARILERLRNLRPQIGEIAATHIEALAADNKDLRARLDVRREMEAGYAHERGVLKAKLDAAERRVGYAEANLSAAIANERERIAAAIEHEADVCPCGEDAAVLRSTAALVRADFSYDDAEKLKMAAEVATEIRKGQP